MKAKQAASRPPVRVGLIEKDPLRQLGYRATFEEDPELELLSLSYAELLEDRETRILMLGSSSGVNLFDRIADIRSRRPEIRILVIGAGSDDETILKAIAAGVKGYVNEAAQPEEFLQAVKMVSEGSVWAPRRVLSLFIDRVTMAPSSPFAAGKKQFTPREREVLELLVAGRSNREIAKTLGIEERTVKSHVAKLMRKVGVQNRISLTMQAISHALLDA